MVLTYIAGGIGTSSTDIPDVYIAKFELTYCPPPTNLQAIVSPGCTITFSWNANDCSQPYVLRYRKINTLPWTTISTSATSYPTVLSSGTYEWKVKTQCSPNVSSIYAIANSTVFVPVGCRLADENSDFSNELLSVYPNPSYGAFEVSVHLPQQINESITLDILDQVGKVVSSTQEKMENGLLDAQMSISNLPAGFYWVRIIVEGKTYLTKLVKQKS